MSLPTIHVFDTMTGEKRPLETVKPGHVGLYVCGVTVYDYAHIGHARVYVSFDVITRYLKKRGYEVTYVRNFTDVDDKIIKRANELGEDPLALSARFADAFDEDMDALGVLPVDVAPKVSTHIEPIIEITEQLIERGHAYNVDGDVFFEVSTDDDYGKLSRVDLDANRAGERVAVDGRKRAPADFALWKSKKPNEPAWDSPWGEGRPGWHIECSAMSMKHLGDTVDIHGGGKDLVFPHHENEIAQSECASGHAFCNYWMHVGLVSIDGEKMSKSLNNFWTIRDVLALYHPEAVRWFFLSGHYRKPIAYSQDNLELARHRLQYLYGTREALAALWQRVERPEAPHHETIDAWAGAFHEAMDDDFNTPRALAIIGEVAKTANELLTTKKIGKKPDVLAKLVAAEVFFDAIGEVFGVLGEDPSAVLTAIRDMLATQLEVDAAWVAQAIADRKAAREAKDWAAADQIRASLAEKFVVLMDGAEGTTWRIEPPAPSDDAPAD